jgi:hypothetical protein
MKWSKGEGDWVLVCNEMREAAPHRPGHIDQNGEAS